MPERAQPGRERTADGAVGRRRTMLRLFTLALLAVVGVWWWAILRQGAPAALPRPVDAEATISHLLAARRELGLSPDQVYRLQALQRRLRSVLQPLERANAEELRRLGNETRKGKTAADAGLRRRAQVTSALGGAEQEINRRYQRQALSILTARQRTRAARLGVTQQGA